MIWEVRHGDCVAGMNAMPECSVDSIVTDPPYHLTSVSRGGSPRMNDPSTPHGRTRLGEKGFMGKTWDGGDIAFRVETWQAALRVLKPGGHLLAFSGTRTYHRMVCAIEDAGFEIRDQIGWVYGSGFPKSLDVSKAIDLAGGSSPVEQAGLLRQKREAAALTRAELARLVGCTESSIRDWEEGRARTSGGALEFMVPSQAYRLKLADLLGYSEDERKLIRNVRDRRNDGSVYRVGHSGQILSGANTAASNDWRGWGTALKPAWEPIVVARKPLIGTVAANVLAHGTGALNIDGCRVGWPGGVAPEIGTPAWGGPQKKSSAAPGQEGETVERIPPSVLGRWPANIIHDGSDEVLAAFPQAPGQQAKVGPEHGAKTSINTFGDFGPRSDFEPRGDAGSAARFFYCAKASKADRNDGCGEIEARKYSHDGRKTPIDNAYQRNSSNSHPTVKPTDLMRYLCRLVTPPGGTVLDPFTGSGSTGRGAVLEGFDFVGFELDPDNEGFVEIARRRIAAAEQERGEELADLARAAAEPKQEGLFA